MNKTALATLNHLDDTDTDEVERKFFHTFNEALEDAISNGYKWFMWDCKQVFVQMCHTCGTRAELNQLGEWCKNCGGSNIS